MHATKRCHDNTMAYTHKCTISLKLLKSHRSLILLLHAVIKAHTCSHKQLLENKIIYHLIKNL